MNGFRRYGRARERLWATARGRLILVAISTSLVVTAFVTRPWFGDDSGLVFAGICVWCAWAATIWFAEREDRRAGRTGPE